MRSTWCSDAYCDNTFFKQWNLQRQPVSDARIITNFEFLKAIAKHKDIYDIINFIEFIRLLHFFIAYN